MDRRTLLLESSRLQDLKIDGPAILVRAYGKSRQWFPMRRISSLICIELPSRGLEVLTQVAGHGIPVNFFSTRGKLLAQLVHPGHIPGPLAHWLESAAWDPELMRTYENWLDNQLRHAYGLLGCMACDSTHAALAADTQLQKISRKENCQSMVNEARDWCQSMLCSQIQYHGMARGLSASSSQMARIISDLLPAGVALCLTFIALNARRSNQLRQKNFARFYQGHLGEKIDSWINRALFALANALEKTAMYQDSPLRDFR